MRKETVLKNLFKKEKFTDGQEKLIDALVSGKDTLAVFPAATEEEKSVCFNIAAELTPGITIVISPVILLIRSVLDDFIKNGVKLTALSQNAGVRETNEIMLSCAGGNIKTLYISPERLLSSAFRNFIENGAEISLICIDEAHSVSDSSYDQRQSYCDIESFLKMFPKRVPVCAFTNVATPEMLEDIKSAFDLKNPTEIITSYDRPNLFFDVRFSEQKNKDLLELISGRFDKNKRGIVYCSSRADVERVCGLLNQNGYNSGSFHAGMTKEERQKNKDDFMSGKNKIISATVAFGIGMESSDVDYVIHYGVPKSVQSYYLEAVRAGRDGRYAECVLLYNQRDVDTIRWIILNANNKENKFRTPKRRESELKLLKSVISYANSKKCFRGFLLNYFGEKSLSDNFNNSGYNCGNCGNCAPPPGNLENLRDLRDITVDAQKIISCVACLSEEGRNFDAGTVIRILIGVTDNRIAEQELDKFRLFGIMSEHDRQSLGEIFNSLLNSGFLSLCRLPDTAYDVVIPGPRSEEIKRNNFKLALKNNNNIQQKKKEEKIPENNEIILLADDKKFLEKLKDLRVKLARGESKRPNTIFSDETLLDICEKMPMSEAEMLEVEGIGVIKFEKYGDRFLEEVRNYARNIINAVKNIKNIKSIEKPEINEKAVCLNYTPDKIKTKIKNETGEKNWKSFVEAGGIGNIKNISESEKTAQKKIPVFPVVPVVPVFLDKERENIKKSEIFNGVIYPKYKNSDKIQVPEDSPRKTERQKVIEIDRELFKKLKALRAMLAAEEKIAPPRILLDFALRDICVRAEGLNKFSLMNTYECWDINNTRSDHNADEFINEISDHIKSGEYQAPLNTGKDLLTVVRERAHELKPVPEVMTFAQFCDNIMEQLGIHAGTKPIFAEIERILVDNGILFYDKNNNINLKVNDDNRDNKNKNKSAFSGIEKMPGNSKNGKESSRFRIYEKGQAFLIELLKKQ